jgi:hypothetical protein
MNTLDKIFIIVGAVLLGLLAFNAARAQPVDIALVLATDVSGSISAEEYELQKKGIIDALRDPRVLETIKKGPHGAIALTYVEWSNEPIAVVEWKIIETKADINSFTSMMESSSRTDSSFTAMGKAIEFSLELILNCPCEPLRKIIDLSADGTNNGGIGPEAVAWERIQGNGILVNGLAIEENADSKDMEQYLKEHLNGFVVSLKRFEDMYEAMLQKLILEIM